MALRGTPYGHAHESCNDEIEARCDDGVVEGLRQRSVLAWQLHAVCGCDYKRDKEDGGDEPANYGDWLCNVEGKPASHIEEKGEIGD